MKFRRLTFVSSALLLIFALLITGCGGAKYASENVAYDGSSERPAVGAVETTAAPSTVAPIYTVSQAEAEKVWGITDTGLSNALTSGEEVVRRIIRHATVEQKVTNLDEAILKVNELVAQSKGYQQSSSIHEYSNNERVASFVLRIPTGSYDDVLQQIRMIGKNVSTDEKGEDVTEEYYDNEARIKNLKLQEEAVQRLFDQADKMEDILAIQKELFYIRGEIERYEGRNRYLDNLTSLSTIELVIREVKPVEYLEQESDSAFSRAKEGFVASLQGIANFFVEFFVYAISALPILIILIGVLAFALWILFKVVKKRNQLNKPDVTESEGNTEE